MQKQKSFQTLTEIEKRNINAGGRDWAFDVVDGVFNWLYNKYWKKKKK